MLMIILSMHRTTTVDVQSSARVSKHFLHIILKVQKKKKSVMDAMYGSHLKSRVLHTRVENETMFRHYSHDLASN